MSALSKTNLLKAIEPERNTKSNCRDAKTICRMEAMKLVYIDLDSSGKSVETEYLNCLMSLSDTRRMWALNKENGINHNNYYLNN